MRCVANFFWPGYHIYMSFALLFAWPWAVKYFLNMVGVIVALLGGNFVDESCSDFPCNH